MILNYERLSMLKEAVVAYFMELSLDFPGKKVKPRQKLRQYSRRPGWDSNRAPQ
jgi:hypothetical protein